LNRTVFVPHLFSGDLHFLLISLQTYSTLSADVARISVCRSFEDARIRVYRNIYEPSRSLIIYWQIMALNVPVPIDSVVDVAITIVLGKLFPF
jgi:hypothetical protein